MSDIAKNIKSFDSSPQFDPYSKIIIDVDEQTQYVAGDDTGRSLTFACPWGTQRIADGLLLQIQGYAYQPFTATGALVSMALELGDEITVNGVTSRMFNQDIQFGPLCASDISAPDGEEIDHEFPYIPAAERKTQRQIVGLKTENATLADRVAALEGLLSGVSRATQTVTTPSGTADVNYLRWEENNG